jgi:hypothetical protein
MKIVLKPVKSDPMKTRSDRYRANRGGSAGFGRTAQESALSQSKYHYNPSVYYNDYLGFRLVRNG